MSIPVVTDLVATVMSLIAHLQQNPTHLMLIAYFAYKFYQSKRPFPEAGPNVHTIASMEEFEKNVTGKDCGNCVVDFYATWCPPCKAAVPVYTDLSEKVRFHLTLASLRFVTLTSFAPQFTEIKFYKVNVDNTRDVSGKEGVKAMPTFKFYNAGSCIETIQGFSQSQIEAQLQKMGKKAE